MSDPDDTPARLILAAEELFADGGEEATSLRAISRAARSNAAAVHYHFGGRDELLRAVVERHLAPLAARRFELLDVAVLEHGGPVPVPVLVEAVVRPEVELLAALRPERVRLARLLGRVAALPGTAAAALVARQDEALAARAVPLLRASVPGVGADELGQRLRWIRSVVATAMATAGEPGEPGPFGADEVTEQLRRLIPFATGGLTAPGKPPKKTKKR